MSLKIMSTEVKSSPEEETEYFKEKYCLRSKKPFSGILSINEFYN